MANNRPSRGESEEPEIPEFNGDELVTKGREPKPVGSMPSSGLDVKLKAIAAKLRDGGPPVDYGLLVDFIDDKLDPDQRRSVGEAIVTWKAWYDGYIETLGADEGKDQG